MDWNRKSNSELAALTRHSLRGSVDWNFKIELTNSEKGWSLPSRECGLKLEKMRKKLKCELSLPSRECGLKYYREQRNPQPVGHSLRGSVDWNFSETVRESHSLSHSLRGSVDWNSFNISYKYNWYCHSLRGSVDWNCNFPGKLWYSCRHSLRGSVDWNVSTPHFLKQSSVTPFAGVWIEIGLISCIPVIFPCHSLRGSVDWNS